MTEPNKANPIAEEQNDEIRVALDFIEGIWGKPEPVEAKGVDGETLGQKSTNTLNEAIDVTERNAVTRDQSLPKSIGRFQLKRKLGEGGFAKVFLARDPTLNRNVALKVLKPSQFFSDDTSARFDREAQAAAILNHPNIVPVFETGCIDDQCYIASAFSDGKSLEMWLKQDSGSLPVSKAVAMVVQLAEAVNHAHQRGVIHRDLKPANILVEPDFNEDDSSNRRIRPALDFRLRITDFGLARYNDSLDQFETTEGAIVGTPAYMSPEQASGKLDLDSRTDIYSLGVILYELLTGKVPIEGETHIDTLLAIGQTTPKPPSKWNPNIPRDLEAICLKCLEKSPSRRYPSAHDLAQDLQHWSHGEPVSARVTTSIEKVGKWCRRNPLLTAAFVALCVALGLAITQWNAANRNWQNAQVEIKRSQRAIAFSQETLSEMVGRVSGMQQLPAETRYELTQRAVSLQNRLLDEDPENDELKYNTAYANLHLSRVFIDLRNHDAAIECCDDGLDLLSEIEGLPEDDSLQERLTTAKASVYRLIGDFETAAKLLEIDPEADPKGTMDEASRLRDLAHTLIESGDPASGLIQLQRSRLVFESLGDNIFATGNFAFALYLQGQAELDLDLPIDAEQTLEYALEKQKYVVSQSSFHEKMEEMLATIELKLSMAKERVGKPDEAKQKLATAIERYEMLCEWNPNARRYLDALLQARLLLVGTLLNERAFDEAAAQLDATKPWLQKLKADDPNFRQLTVALCTRVIAFAKQLSPSDSPSDGEQLDGLLTLLEEQIALLESSGTDPQKIAPLRTALNELRD